MLSWLWSYLGPLFPHDAFRNGEVYTGIWRYMVCFSGFERDYIIGLISVESLTFGLNIFEIARDNGDF